MIILYFINIVKKLYINYLYKIIFLDINLYKYYFYIKLQILKTKLKKT